ncbi:MAG TPA: PKD domain-containing protein, partial [Chitinophagales bacterium]|nr:PKD domain-containing protein [Chitinophagales bacterium]
MRSFFTTCLLLSVGFVFAAGDKPAQISADKISGCSPLQVNFQSSLPAQSSYSWDLGNGTTSTAQQPSVVYVKPGVYTVKLLLDNSSEPVTTTITVNGIPQVDFATDKTKACVGDGVNFTAQPAAGTSIVNYVWGFGDGKTVSGANMAQTVHAFKGDGKYDISLLVTDANGCMATRTAYSKIEAVAKPVADFKPSVSSSCNETEQISFTNMSTGGYKLDYAWDFGDKTASADMNPSHLFTQGKFDVTLTVKDENGCSNTVSKKVSVTKLKADFISEKDQACTGEKLKFVNASNYKGTKWLWSFSDGSTSVEANPLKAFAQPGSYSVKFTVTDGECTETSAKEAYIHVRPGIKTEFTSDVSSSCNEPVSVKLKNNTPNSAVVLWNFGDGTVSTKNETEKVYAAAGNYKVSLEVTDSSGCTIKKENEK